MITREQLTNIGKFGHPHGINGELNASVDPMVDITALRCILVGIDGIFVPFFVSGVRSRSQSSLLLTIDDINDETEATLLQNKDIYALKEDYMPEEDGDADGFYADDLIGFKVITLDGKTIGRISDFDDSTDNVLFIVKDENSGKVTMIPVADEFVSEIDPKEMTITVTLPDGLLEL